MIIRRHEADSLDFPKFDGSGSFRDKWSETRRTIQHQSGRPEESALWWKQVEDLENVTYEDLAESGPMFKAYDGKILVGLLKSVEDLLKRKIMRYEELAHKNGKIFTGRQAGRLIFNDFKADNVSRNLLNITHLMNLAKPRDDNLAGFLLDWHRILDDQEYSLSVELENHVFCRIP